VQPFHLNKTSRVPYYYQIEEWLRSQIASGALSPGDPLPGEISLSQQLGVSRIVVRQALSDLTNEGLLVRRRALGTFVAPPRRQVPILRDHLRGLTEDLSREGLTVRSRVLSQRVTPAEGEAMHELQVEPGTPLLEIRRLRSVQNIPIVIETTYHPYQRFPALLHTDLADRSIYAILEQEYDAHPVQARDRFVAEAAAKEDAALLEIEPGDPVMRYKRTARDQLNQLMEFTISIYRADQYQFVIEYKEIGWVLEM
jgi:GntR family transcriptional regulator